jgi:hypothetical protein
MFSITSLSQTLFRILDSIALEFQTQLSGPSHILDLLYLVSGFFAYLTGTMLFPNMHVVALHYFYWHCNADMKNSFERAGSFFVVLCLHISFFQFAAVANPQGEACVFGILISHLDLDGPALLMGMLVRTA